MSLREERYRRMKGSQEQARKERLKAGRGSSAPKVEGHGHVTVVAAGFIFL